MAYLDVKNKVLQCKIVYCGPALSGKTTNLEYTFKKLRNKIKTDLVSIKTYGDRTMFFDFLPIGMGRIRGYAVRLQLYTVPVQVQYNATRRLVLKGVDGIAFVADSMEERRKDNIESLKNLQENLSADQKDITTIPLILQYNKRDMINKGLTLLTIETLEADLNSQLKVPSFPACALEGNNVIETLKSLLQTTLNHIVQQLDLTN